MRKVEQIRDQHSRLVTIKEIKEDYLVCEATKADQSKIQINVSKPYALRVSPFDAKTLNYNVVGLAEATVSVTYSYVANTNFNKRVASYPSASTRCKAGDHIETIFPPYQVGDTLLASIGTVGNFEDAVTHGKLVVDENRDGRHWQDDCGAGTGGGAVWV